jgi:hypothetical protein
MHHLGMLLTKLQRRPQSPGNYRQREEVDSPGHSILMLLLGRMVATKKKDKENNIQMIMHYISEGSSHTMS